MSANRFTLEFHPFDIEKDMSRLVKLLDDGHAFMAHEGGLLFELVREYEIEKVEGQTIIRFIDERGYMVYPLQMQAYAEIPRVLE
jgi:hypothetical protein